MALIQQDWCPYKKRVFGHHTQKTTDDGGGDWSVASTSQGTPRTASPAQKLEEAGKDSPQHVSEGTWSCQRLDFGLLPLEL